MREKESVLPKAITAVPGFHGWRIVGWSTVLVALTAPGQTAAVSMFIDPMIAELGVSRTAISTAYLIGTLTGALAMPFVGRMLDRHGVRRVLLVVGLVFGSALCALSAVTSLVGLTGGFVAIRMAGQGALGLAATTAVALWFDRRRGTALGIVSALGASAISLAPVLLEALIADWGWRRAWLIEGVVVLAVVLPVARWAMHDRPADLGQHPDGITPTGSAGSRGLGATRGQALRTPFFWVLTAAVAACGLLGTAVNFHQISLLTARGLTATEAAANFLPQTVAALAATFGVGWLTDRVRPRPLIALSISSLAGALVLATVVRPGLTAVAFGLLLGAAGGSIRAVEAATFPRLFGTAHIGAIRGVVTAVSVGSTAFGPILFATLQAATGAYTVALVVGAVVPVIILLVALVVGVPAPIPASRAVSPSREGHGPISGG